MSVSRRHPFLSVKTGEPGVYPPGFRLRNGFIQRRVTPGGKAYLAVNLQNMTTDTLHLVPRLIDWGIDANGLPIFAESGEMQPRSCNDWLKMEADQLEVLPSKSASFRLEVNTPDEIAGEYYSAMVFDSDRPRPELPKEFLSGRTQLIALTSPKDLEEKIAIDSVIFNREDAGTIPAYRFNVRVNNLGNTHCYTLGNLSIEHEVAAGVYEVVGTRSEFGHKEAMVLPGGWRDFDILTQDLQPGKYRAVVSVTYADEQSPEVRFQPFVIQ